jgi:hypothetical protein
LLIQKLCKQSLAAIVKLLTLKYGRLVAVGLVVLMVLAVAVQVLSLELL